MCILTYKSKAAKMFGVGRGLLTGTGFTSAPPVSVAAKPCSIPQRRHTATVRATVTCTIPAQELALRDAGTYSTGFPSTNTSEPQWSASQAGGLHMEGTHSYASDSMKRLQQSLPGVPSGMEGISEAFLSGAAAKAATGQLQRAGYDWIHSMLIVMAWQQTTAEQKLAKFKLAAATAGQMIREAEEGLDKASKHLQTTAASFSWRLLNTLNANGYQPGLAYEQLPLHFQVFAYSLLLKCGCLGSWGQPAYRQLPAIAATITPGRIVAVPINQYLGIAQHLPRVCRDEMDGTWTGEAQVRISPFQVVTDRELAKALGPEMLLPLFTSGSGFAADLAAAAAKVGVLDGAVAAAACGTSSTSSLAEVLLLKFTNACVGLSTAALVNMRRTQQQETSLMPSPAVVAGESDSSYCCLACSCGGAGGGRRGSLTAIGADEFNDDEEGKASLVPVRNCEGTSKGTSKVPCKGTSKVQEECTVRLVQINNRRGLIHRFKSFVRRFHKN